jgi:hypothetical protein
MSSTLTAAPLAASSVSPRILRSLSASSRSSFSFSSFSFSSSVFSRSAKIKQIQRQDSNAMKQSKDKTEIWNSNSKKHLKTVFRIRPDP